MAKRTKFLIKYEKKKLKPDSLFHSYFFNKLLNQLMMNGNKPRIDTLFFKYFLMLKLDQKKKKNYYYYFMNYIYKTKPSFIIIRKRLGPRWIKLPAPLKPRLQSIFSLRWLYRTMRKYRTQNLKGLFENFFSDLTINVKKNYVIKMRNNFYTTAVTERTNITFRWQ